MAANFPEGHGDESPPSLTPSTFTDCMAALEEAYDGGLSPLGASTLNRWWGYASDGDISKLPVVDGMVPWEYLKSVCGQKLQGSVSDLDSDQKELLANWHSDASDVFVRYLGRMHDQLQNYAGAPGNSGGSAGASGGGWVDQVAALLESAYTVQVAFKKDLYAIAHATYKALKELNAMFSWDNTKKFALLVVNVASVAINPGNLALFASDVANQVFAQALSTTAATAGSYLFKKPADNASIGGDHDWDVFDSMNSAITTTLNKYKDSVRTVTSAMDRLWPSLNYAATNPPRCGAVGPVNEVSPSLNLRNFFPNAG
ncbi:hypothetical protein [Amycolatopsis taiwanensis]|uniref:Uncharacterized protein n=1 Tax=Amycolatopsis taiwanensis TaxID=342230 RepID=A0A9W6R527_9PSEU|nr:hypothetical protein [Amycolatopsis taiwanensis]GLY69611.1 hypothetical protein Atai01_62300 [Amycolatopsis taiwanensis]